MNTIWLIWCACFCVALIMSGINQALKKEWMGNISAALFAIVFFGLLILLIIDFERLTELHIWEGVFQLVTALMIWAVASALIKWIFKSCRRAWNSKRAKKK